MADIIDLETFRELLRMRFYMEWIQTLDDDVPYSAFDYELFIVTPEVSTVDQETAEFLQEFFGREDDAFHFDS